VTHRETLVIGTGNPAKIEAVRAALEPLALTVKGTGELGVSLHVEEDGQTAQENARKKARAYAKALGRPVLSIDNALYLDGLPGDQQPGIDTRHVPGHAGRATDEVLLHFYAETVKRLGGRATGYWEYALCIADASGRTFEATTRSRRTFVSEPSRAMVPGYPLESIQIDPESGKYIAEMTQGEQAAFWQKTVGQALRDFVRSALAKGQGDA
jgi:XTP/dITP diphosphohydrolase